MNVKEFMETQKNSNEIEKEEVATALNFKHVQLLQPLFLNYERFTTAFFPQKAIPIFTIE